MKKMTTKKMRKMNPMMNKIMTKKKKKNTS